MAESVYKIVSEADWASAVATGRLDGTPDDVADGYIHFSNAAQLQGTLDKHYRGRSDLVIATVDPGLLPLPLKWEPSRGGELFPHLYGPLPVSAIVGVHRLDAGADGQFDLSGVI